MAVFILKNRNFLVELFFEGFEFEDGLRVDDFLFDDGLFLFDKLVYHTLSFLEFPLLLGHRIMIVAIFLLLVRIQHLQL